MNQTFQGLKGFNTLNAGGASEAFEDSVSGGDGALMPLNFGLIYFGRPEVKFLIYVEDSAG
ncbi:MAG: hypothetical protein DKT66_04530 [Candidatus Melainabacteria bacterium]|nr:MAG: hypothetical protein DKT66_04530 [Candidatus Melainabacteria bacterium]